MHSPERRRIRSENARDAMRLYLQHVRRNGRHRSVALADCCGHLVIGTDDSEETRSLAAAAPLAESDPGRLPAPLKGLNVWNVALGDEAYYVVADGGRDGAPMGLRGALKRILPGARVTELKRKVERLRDRSARPLLAV